MRGVITGTLICGTVAAGSCERRLAPPAPPSSATGQPVETVVDVEAMDEATLARYAERGGKYWLIKGCNACHSLDGTKGIGASAAGLWGKPLRQKDGSEIVVDAAFIRESVFDPAKTITAGYPNQMNGFVGRVTDDELRCLTALYRSLKDWKPPSPGG